MAVLRSKARHRAGGGGSDGIIFHLSFLICHWSFVTKVEGNSKAGPQAKNEKCEMMNGR